MREAMAMDRKVAIGMEAVGVLLALGTVVLFRDAVIDDAFISLRHVKNALAGHGLVWNVGERVEGFTNLGFVLPVLVMGICGIDLVLAARIVGLVGALLAVIYGPRVVIPDGDDARLLRGAARLMILGNFAFVYLSWTGMETCFFSGLLCAGAWALTKSGYRFGLWPGVLLGWAFVVRPEGAIIAAACLLVACGTHGWKGVLRQCGPWVLAVLVVAVTAWRLYYYGAPVPNTAVAKGILHASLPWYAAFGDELVDAVTQTGGPVCLILAAVGAWRGVPRRAVHLALGVLGCLVFFEVYSWGDWMSVYRYLAPGVPFFAGLVVAGIGVVARAVTADGTKVFVPSVMVVTACIAVYEATFAVRFWQTRDEYPQFVMTSRDLVRAAKWVGQRAPAGWQITCWRIGALGYFTDLRVIDLYGLTDPYLARTGHRSPAARAYLEERECELAMGSCAPFESFPREQVTAKCRYELVKDFPQGAWQRWLLYQRSDLPLVWE